MEGKPLRPVFMPIVIPLQGYSSKGIFSKKFPTFIDKNGCCKNQRFDSSLTSKVNHQIFSEKSFTQQEFWSFRDGQAFLLKYAAMIRQSVLEILKKIPHAALSSNLVLSVYIFKVLEITLFFAQQSLVGITIKNHTIYPKMSMFPQNSTMSTLRAEQQLYSIESDSHCLCLLIPESSRWQAKP